MPSSRFPLLLPSMTVAFFPHSRDFQVGEQNFNVIQNVYPLPPAAGGPLESQSVL